MTTPTLPAPASQADIDYARYLLFRGPYPHHVIEQARRERLANTMNVIYKALENSLQR